MEKELSCNFIKLKNRIWKTYKSRINAAERLKRNNEFIAFLSIYYSAILAAISILNYVNESKIMDVCSIVLSVIVTILFLYFEGRNYKERYINMKNNYNELNSLYYKVESSIELQNFDKDIFEELTEKYIRLLNDVENHLERDYIKYALKDSEVKINLSSVISYYLWNIIAIIIKVFVFLVPTVMLVIAFIELIIK